jgi:PAS domain S-box-containing protein
MSSTPPTDNTERMAAVRALSDEARASASRFELLVDQLPFSVQLFDPTGLTVRVNRAWEKLWGVTLEQLGPYNVLEDQQLVARGIMPYIRRAFAGEAVEIPPIPYIPPVGDFAGQQRWTRAIIFPVLNDDGTVREVVLVHEDITARVQAEESLTHQTRLLEALTESVLDGILIVAPDGRVLHSNQRFREIWNFPPEVLASGSDEAALAWAATQTPDPEAFLERIRRVYETPDCPVREELILKNGRVYERFGSPIRRDNERLGWVWTFRDITERKQAEQSLERARHEAEEANRAKDHFLATLSHELRTPLMPVLMSIATLREDPSLSDAARAELEVIQRNVQLETVLIDDLLDLTRIAHGKLELRADTVDVHAAIEQALRISAAGIAKKELRVTKDFAARQHHCSADAARLQQAFWNIIKNAVKFTPAGGELHISTRDAGDDRICIDFTDTGIGIEPELQSRIFGAFEQGSRTITSRYGGLGLGLAIASRVVAMHHGEISVQSAGTGHGATFTIILPVTTRCQSATVPVSGDPRSASGGPKSGGLILLVEDHADTARTIQRLLQNAGYRVLVAGNLAAARDLASAHTFDLIISDIGLPDGSGLDLLQQICPTDPVPAIAVSGYGMKADIDASRAAGFAEHLTKPVDWAQLRDAVQRLAVGKQAGHL